ncbi:MAG: DUF4062 domain-containing protein, partial [Verrucomicrobiales bacterium]|nr:DUF4062 domain-containing protein [Verrucomicrobiales bacterium]
MLPTDKTFRVFISSTFSDLQAERNTLQKFVFPRLSELCRRRGARFQPIDLRWGVSEEAGHEQTTMSICLGEIARCQRLSPRPNFLLLLGERYGWRPVPTEIPTQLFRRFLQRLRSSERNERPAGLVLERFYRQDHNARPSVHCLQPRRGPFKDYGRWAAVEREILAIFQDAAKHLRLSAEQRALFGASATEQETLAGALNVPSARGQAHFFFRTVRGLPQDRRAGVFLDLDKEGCLDNEAGQRLQNLKQTLVRRYARHVHEYSVRWVGRGISTKHLDERGLPSPTEVLAEPRSLQPASPQHAAPNFCRDVYSCLGKVIHQELASWRQQDPLEREIGMHERFRQEWGDPERFVGRQRILNRIVDYVRAATPWPLTVHGASGAGKSALIARAIAVAKRRHPGAAIVFRFLGVTPESSNGRALLENLCRQIAAAYGDTDRPVPSSYLDLLRDFSERLKLA